MSGAGTGCEAAGKQSGRALTLRAGGLDDRPCPVLLSFTENGTTLDAMSYRSMTLRGEMFAPVSFALADARTGSQGATTFLERPAGRFDLTLSLLPMAKAIDLRDDCSAGDSDTKPACRFGSTNSRSRTCNRSRSLTRGSGFGCGNIETRWLKGFDAGRVPIRTLRPSRGPDACAW